MKSIKAISILFLLLAVSCLRDPEVERNEPDAPTVSCDESSKTRVSFTVSGHVNKIIPNAIYGLIIESEDGAQQEKTFKEQDLSSDNTFLWKVDGLSPGSPYLIKSYISNDYGGRKYSESILVSTPKTSIATLSSVTFDKGSGLLRATIVDDGGRGLEDYGFLYGPSPDIRELKKEKRYSGVLNGIEISLPIGGLKVERPSNFIAYVENKEGHLAYSPSCLPLALIDIYNLEIVPDNGDATIKIGSSIKMIPVVTPTVELPFVWSSDNETVATVDKDGVVTGISEGSSTIKASCGELEATHTIVVESIPVASVSLDPATVSLIEGQSTQLTATVLPENATSQTVSWSSSNESVATVDQHGLVQAMSVGSAYITATADEQSATCQVTVSKLVVPVTSVSLSQPFLTLEEGQSATLVATVSPENATDKTVTWSSSNTAIASVSQDGLVSAITPGSATITAKAGDITATCLVSISATVIPVTSVSLNYDTLSLEEGQSATLVATVFPENATDKGITWTSSNTSVASVSQDGLVTALSSGSATITARAGDRTTSCQVTVSDVVIDVTSISLNRATATLRIGQTTTLVATVQPENATDNNVFWSSSNNAIASVSQDGVVSAIAIGTCTVYATCGGKHANCQIAVISNDEIPVVHVSFSEAEREVYVGEIFSISTTIYPSNATNPQLEWSSSNTAIATVDSDGLITPVGIGECIITATSISGVSASFTCKVVSAAPVFQDSNFREYIYSNFDINKDGFLSRTEAKQIQVINCSNCTSVSGIEFFDSLRELFLYFNNQLTSLDVSHNHKLERLDCDSNLLTSLDVSNNPNLKELFCMSNRLTGLDISNNPNLIRVGCDGNQLTSLDVSNNLELRELSCGGNQLYALDLRNNLKLERINCEFAGLSYLYLSHYPNLHSFNCRRNNLVDLTISGNPVLETIWCDENELISLNASDNVSLTSLSCPNNHLVNLLINNDTKLKEIICWNNQLINIDLSTNVNLTRLECSDNKLQSLDLSNNTLVQILSCSVNTLTSLALGHNTELTHVYCDTNQLNNLDLSGVPNIELLSCNYNQLAQLDLSNNTKIRSITCNYNQLTQIDVSNHPTLEHLMCISNKITSINVSGDSNLTNLRFDTNQVTNVDLSSCANLEELICYFNLLNILDVRHNAKLNHLDCRYNPLTEIWMSPDQTIKELYTDKGVSIHYE